MSCGPVAADVKEASTSVPAYLVNDQMPDSILVQERAGQISDAIRTLTEASTTETHGLSDAIRKTEIERLRRLKREFSQTAEDILGKLAREIPSVTKQHLEDWTKSGAIQWIPVDGEIRYFRREPGNLLRFDAKAKAMQDAVSGKTGDKASDPAGASKKFDLDAHIAKAVAAAKLTSSPLVMPMKFHVTQTVSLKPGHVPEGKTVRCWLPYPQAYRQQKEPTSLRTSPEKNVISTPGTAMRTIYLEQPAGADNKRTTFSAEYDYIGYAFAPKFSFHGDDPRAAFNEPVKSEGNWSGTTKADLEARPPHVVLSPEIVKLSKELTAGETDPLRKAFKIWSWIDENIKWAAEIEYSTITNIVEKVYSCKRGDCGTQALLFVSLCRASGVPARWQSGWVTKPREWNMHDWAEFYTPQYGWLPADPSVGRRKSDDPEVRDYLFGHLDSYRMIANTDCEQPFDPPMQHLRSDPVDNQRGELEWEGGNLYYDQWDYDIQVTSEPVDASQVPAAENP